MKHYIVVFLVITFISSKLQTFSFVMVKLFIFFQEENLLNCTTVEKNGEKPNCDIKQQDNKYTSEIPDNVSLHLKAEVNQAVPDQCCSKNLNYLDTELSPLSEQALLTESTSVTQVDSIGDNPNNDEVSDKNNMSDFYKKVIIYKACCSMLVVIFLYLLITIVIFLF